LVFAGSRYSAPVRLHDETGEEEIEAGKEPGLIPRKLLQCLMRRRGKKMSPARIILKSAVFGIAAMTALLGVYFVILAAVSGWEFTINQFLDFWYFIVSLAAGFGIQIGLYSYLRNAVRGMDMSGKVVAVSGTTSTAAMISCCAHYLTNILPVVGAAGAVALVAQYQIELFWFGLACNLAGIIYMTTRVAKFSRAHAMK
jgi:Cu+-exporting ATPase